MCKVTRYWPVIIIVLSFDFSKYVQELFLYLAGRSHLFRFCVWSSYSFRFFFESFLKLATQIDEAQ